mgnify:CR=1 FL=1
MKKILAIILAAVLVLSFAACKKNDTNNDTTAGDAQTSGQAADVSASDDTASSEEASSEVETEVVTDKEGHTVIETKASQSSDTKTTTKGSTAPSKGLNTNDAAACIKAYQALSPRQSSSRAADRTWLSRAASLLTAASALCSR